MNLPKAIEILNASLTTRPSIKDSDYDHATKLLIEAGKRIEEQRHYFWAYREPLLPGETGETDEPAPSPNEQSWHTKGTARK